MRLRVETRRGGGGAVRGVISAALREWVRGGGASSVGRIREGGAAAAPPRRVRPAPALPNCTGSPAASSSLPSAARCGSSLAPWCSWGSWGPCAIAVRQVSAVARGRGCGLRPEGRWSPAYVGQRVFLTRSASSRMDRKGLVVRRRLQSSFRAVQAGRADLLLSRGLRKCEDQSEVKGLGKSYVFLVILIFDVGRENHSPHPTSLFFFFNSLIAINAIILTPYRDVLDYFLPCCCRDTVQAGQIWYRVFLFLLRKQGGIHYLWEREQG